MLPVWPTFEYLEVLDSEGPAAISKELLQKLNRNLGDKQDQTNYG